MMMMMNTEMVDHKRRSHDSFLLTSLGIDSSKRLKIGGSSTALRNKEKKERVGERVASLQRLVCPFGKTDTASVLEETTGYIRFLHDQLEVLSIPYLRTTTAGEVQEAECYSLRSRGLCVVPVASMVGVARSNGADLWAPANASKQT